MGHAIEESGGELVAGAGGVDHAGNRGGGNDMFLAFLDHDAALGRTRQRGDAAPLFGGGDHAVKIIRLEQRLGFIFVGEQDVHILVQEAEEFVAEPTDAKGIRQRQGDASAGGLHGGDGLARRRLGFVLVPQIAFDIEDARGGDLAFVDVGRHQLAAGAQIGAHAALAIGRHRDHAGGGGRALAGGFGGEGHAQAGHGVAEHLAQPVVEHLADIHAITAQRGDARHSVGGRPARHFMHAAHGLLVVGQKLQQFLGAELVDQGHAALGDAMGQEEAVIHRRDDVHDGIAQTGDIILLRHENPCEIRFRLYGMWRASQVFHLSGGGASGRRQA